MVFDVDQLALQELPVGQKRPHLLHVDVLEVNGAVPAVSSRRVSSERWQKHCASEKTERAGKAGGPAAPIVPRAK
jgi:hypothetical protein